MYVPIGTLRKSCSMIHRIIHARQNSSSIMGTITTARTIRSVSTGQRKSARFEKDVAALPVNAFSNSQEWR